MESSSVYRTSVKDFRGNGQISDVMVQDPGSDGEEEVHPAAAFVSRQRRSRHETDTRCADDRG
jgi:hypothetical protein